MQTYQDLEVVFVAEDKKLMEIVNSHARAIGFDKLKSVLNTTAPGLSESRNLGTRVSSGEIVGFLDDDVVIPMTWVQSVHRVFSDPLIVAATGPVVPNWETNSISWVPPELHWLIGCSTWWNGKNLTEVRNVWGANMAFCREEFESVGGFSNQFGGVHGTRLHGEETDLSLRIRKHTGRLIVYSTGMKVLHRVEPSRLNPRLLIKSAFDMGLTRRILERRHGGRGLLTTEVGLVHSIIIKSLVGPALSLLVRPSGFRKVSLSFLVLVAAFLGYSRALGIRRTAPE